MSGVQAGQGPHPGGNPCAVNNLCGRPGRPCLPTPRRVFTRYGQEMFLRAAPRWKHVFGQHSLSPPGRTSSRPGAVSCREEAQEGRCMEPRASLCLGHTSSGPRAGQPGAARRGRDTQVDRRAKEPLGSVWRQPASEREWTSCSQPPCEVPRAPPLPSSRPVTPPRCPDPDRGDQHEAVSTTPQVGPWPARVPTLPPSQGKGHPFMEISHGSPHSPPCPRLGRHVCAFWSSGTP